MRKSMKQEAANMRSQNLYDVDFHQFVEKEHMLSNYELAVEFGVTLESVKKLKRQIHR
ncbi:RNA polymerase subunit sigma-70 [Pseudalkalibacillus sp. SCS-8]|uniref:RNA polymerase subunit sigma-70 n=1 Tax=Pseudalkalibacillus nanhaiensis TaxID=3115291 RepID=UPI0032D9E785